MEIVLRRHYKQLKDKTLQRRVCHERVSRYVFYDKALYYLLRCIPTPIVKSHSIRIYVHFPPTQFSKQIIGSLELPRVTLKLREGRLWRGA